MHCLVRGILVSWHHMLYEIDPNIVLADHKQENIGSYPYSCQEGVFRYNISHYYDRNCEPIRKRIGETGSSRALSAPCQRRT